MITRKVDQDDSLAGFTYDWVKKIGEQLEKLIVITWQKSDKAGLSENIELISLPENKIKKLLVLKFQLLKILPRVDGVFCHMNPEYTILSAPIAKIFRKKVVSWYTHRAVTLRRRLVELLANKIITASDKSFREPWFKSKVEVLGHGIDINLFRPLSEREKQNVMRLISVGRISPTKDYESMIKAIDILANQGITNIKLNIVGGAGLPGQNIYFDNLKQMAKNMGLADRVEFLGEISHPEIPRYLQHSDVFINLSGTGSVDKAVLEAMACGCVVLTSNEAFAEILPSELMVEKDNPKKLAEKIKWVMELPQEKVISLKQQLRQQVVQNHNLDNLVKKIIEQFK